MELWQTKRKKIKCNIWHTSADLHCFIDIINHYELPLTNISPDISLVIVAGRNCNLWRCMLALIVSVSNLSWAFERSAAYNREGIPMYIRAVTCDFQQCGILTSLDSDEPVQPPIKLRTSNDAQLVIQ